MKKVSTTEMQCNNRLNNFLYNLIILLRPKQWIKNLFVFAGIIFSGNIFNVDLLLLSIYAFIIFCFISSSVYIINDIFDCKNDRIHPVKKNRPIASCKIGIVPALIIAIVIGSLSLTFSYIINLYFFIIVSIYILQSIIYSVWLKNIFIVELFVLSLGFVLRALAGIVIIDVVISPWILVCTYLLSLFIVLNKRRHELIILGDDAILHRPTLNKYSQSLIDNMTSVVTSSTVVTYSLYTFTSEQSQYLMITIPFVIYGIFRYLYLIERKDVVGTPEEILFKDRPMLINIILWIIISGIIVYI